MKMLSFLFVLLSSIQISYSADAVSYFYGDCESTDSLKNYGTINYLRLGYMNLGSSTWTGPSLPDSIPFQSTFVAMCDFDIVTMFDNTTDVMRKYYQPFKNIICGSSTYSLDSNEIEIDLIYTVSTEIDSIYVFELIDASTGVPIAIDYGSDNLNSYTYYPNRLNYLITLDTNNPYESQYIGANLSFNVIYNFGNTYLFEITDDDRDDLLVGFKYLSPKLTSFYIKFIEPNP